MAREPEAHRFYPAGSRFVVFFTIITGYWTHCFFTGELYLSVCSGSQIWMVILLYFRFVKSQQSPSMRGRGLKRSLVTDNMNHIRRLSRGGVYCIRRDRVVCWLGWFRWLDWLRNDFIALPDQKNQLTNQQMKQRPTSNNPQRCCPHAGANRNKKFY